MSGAVKVLLYHRTGDVGGIEAAYHRVSRELAGVPGMLGNELLRSRHDPASFVVISTWESTAAFDEWEQGTEHKNTTAPLRPYRDGELARPFGIYEVTARY
ncbi:antibiotic biosynthesis monooxygenase family protein [Kibdelosporangium phytohabitans]|uniref:Antibiotic biosynthesis monooxygenase n=1 Tax=Kibdelosporangium phytohabitans TaxID=860235 RepID=A0A0N9I4B9_9PSEU|nr:antibiotic biosynthesis monooxygenase family protein [Kibdelosporangium phytohabitans]ALG10909.1 antibiotic biosynthesis monooxygenase [Kibdelosporangium phytohabitans]MBE1462100.1 heme-degrading monooxygenase HmoA [Kibdelosporangium phytohabitans]